MSYLRGTEINEIANDVRLLSIDEIDDISHYLFDSKVKEYNIFGEVAQKFFERNSRHCQSTICINTCFKNR